METETTGVENFLGVCLGGKRCKKRRKSRQDNRKARREAKTLSKVEDAKSKALANAFLQQTLMEEPKQVQVLSKQSVAQQKTLPPVPQNPPKKEDKTLLWIGSGLGTLIILGLIAFLVLKK